ncbi:Os05g0557700, partial [Oryza sativa Japonica Group]
SSKAKKIIQPVFTSPGINTCDKLFLVLGQISFGNCTFLSIDYPEHIPLIERTLQLGKSPLAKYLSIVCLFGQISFGI